VLVGRDVTEGIAGRARVLRKNAPQVLEVRYVGVEPCPADAGFHTFLKGELNYPCFDPDLTRANIRLIQIFCDPVEVRR